MAEKKIKFVDLSSGIFSAASRFLAVEDGDNVMLEGSDMANKICNSFAYTQDLDTTAKIPVAAVNEISPRFGIVLVGTLAAGNDHLAFYNNAITANSMIDYNCAVDPTDVEVQTGQVTFTFDTQEEDMIVKVVIN